MKEEKSERSKALGKKGHPKKPFIDLGASMEDERQKLQPAYFKAIKKDINNSQFQVRNEEKALHKQIRQKEFDEALKKTS